MKKYVPYIIANVAIEYSNGELEDLARLISKQIFGGIKFVGKEKFIRDEVPAIYIESDLFGLKVVLTEEDDFYGLEIYPADFPSEGVVDLVKNDNFLPITPNNELDISSYISYLLSRIDGIKIREE